MGFEHDINEQDGMDNVAEDLMRDSSDALGEAKDIGENAIETGKDIVDTVRDIPDRIKNTKEKINNAKDKIDNFKNRNNSNNTNNPSANSSGAGNEAMKAGSRAGSDAARSTAQTGSQVGGEAAKGTAKAGEETAKVGGEAAKGTAETAKNSAKALAELVKNAPEALKNLGDILVKVIQGVIKFIGQYWEVILCLLVFFVCLWIGLQLNALIFNEESAADSKNFNGEATDYNHAFMGKDGELDIQSYSATTKLIEAFYQYVSEKSIWVVYEGTVHNDEKLEHDDVMGNVYEPVQYNTKEFNEKFKDEDGNIILKDRDGREANFYINPNALFVYDKAVHREQLRFPEQIVQHVYYEGDKTTLDNHERFKLKHLTDDDRILTVESQFYKAVKITSNETSEEFRESDYYKNNKNRDILILVPDGDKKTKGVWDYGLGSILHYEKYIVLHEMRGSYSSFQVWDKNPSYDAATGLYSYGQVKEFSSYEEYEALSDSERGNCDGTTIADKTGDDRLVKYTEEDFPVELASEEVYFIDWVVTPAGDVENEIIYTWVDTNKPWTMTKQLPAKNYSGKKEVIKTRATGGSGSLTYPGTKATHSTKDCCMTSIDTTYVDLYVLPRPVRDGEGSAVKSADTLSTNASDQKSVDWPSTCNPTKDTSTTYCGKKESAKHKHTDDCYTICGNSKHAHSDSCYVWSHANCGTFTYPLYEEYVEEEEITENKALTYTEKGTYWDKDPYYNGEPDMTNLSGLRYYEDYLTHYDTWIPYNVTGFFDAKQILERMNINGDLDDPEVQKEIDSILSRSWTTGEGQNSLETSAGHSTGNGSNKFEQLYNGSAKALIEQIWDTAIEWGYTEEQAAAILGNMCQESGFDTNAVNSSSGATGLCQWLGGRLDSMKAFASGYNNAEWNDVTSQIQFAMMELDGANTYSWCDKQWFNGWDEFSTNTNVCELAGLMCTYWERSGEGPGDTGYENRLEYATSAYTLLKGRTPTTAVPKVEPNGSAGGITSTEGSSISNVFNSIYGWLKTVGKSISKNIKNLFGWEDEYYNVYEVKERFAFDMTGAVPESEFPRIMETVFAYTDGVLKSDYYNKIDDDFFRQNFTTLFSNPIGKKWNPGSGSDGVNSGGDNEQLSLYQAQRELYYPSGFQRPLENCKLADKDSDKGVYFISTAGENVFAPTDGTIVKIGEDNAYGGTYLIIDNGSSRTIIGNINIKDGLKVGSSVKCGDVIGTAAGTELFFGIENKDRVPVDPGFVLYIAGECESYYPTAGPATSMPVIPQIQEAYRNYPYGYNTIWGGGCGPSSFAMCLSYIKNTFIPTHEVVDTLHYDIHNGNKDAYYSKGQGSFHSIFKDLANHYGINCADITASESSVKKALDEGKVVIISIGAGSIYKGGGHFITIRGYDSTGFWINDSNVGGGAFNCNQTYKWNQITPVKSARALW